MSNSCFFYLFGFYILISFKLLKENKFLNASAMFDKVNYLLRHYKLILKTKKLYYMFGSVDSVPPSLPISYGRAKLYAMEDNDAVIKMCVWERSPALRHVSRTHRIDLDWLFERISKAPGVFIKFVPTKEQVADVLTKGSFTAEAWNTLCQLRLILPRSSLKTKPKV